MRIAQLFDHSPAVENRSRAHAREATLTEVVVLIPVLARPARVEPLLESLRASERETLLRPLFLVSPDDRAEIDALERARADHALVGWPPGRGDWARKINHGYRLTSEPWLLLGADDLAFAPGWAEEALRLARRRGVRVIGTADGGRNPAVRSGTFSPHPLVARSYVEELGGTLDESGEVLCELYDHNWPDRELADVARLRSEWAFAPLSIVAHLHPNWPGGLERDATYERGERRFQEDAALFRSRRALWDVRARGRVV
jgi:hypothetical protein